MLELVMLVSLAAAGAALIRGRPATVILSLSQVVVLRGLSSIRDYGQSSSYVPGIVYRAENITTATFILSIAAVGLLFAAVLPAGRPPSSMHAASLPRVPPLLVGAVLLYFGAQASLAGTIFQFAYADDRLNRSVLDVGGARVLMYGLLIYEAYRRVATKQNSPITMLVAFFGFCVVADFLKGSTGIAIGVLFTVSILLLMHPSRTRGAVPGRLAVAGTYLAMAVFAVLVIRTARHHVASGGMAAISNSVSEISAQEQQRQSTGRGLESFANGVQGAEHVLECVTLYDAGYGRQWRSIYAPIEYTFKPAFLLNPLGLERSKEAAWELGDYFIHGGGINVIGEFYWNGGYLCVVVMSLLLAWFAFLCDTRYTTSPVWLVMLCNFAPGLLMGYEYGFAQVSRGAINGCLVVVGFAVARRLFRGVLGPSPSLHRTQRAPSDA